MAKEKISEAAKGRRMLIIGLACLPIPVAAWTCLFTIVREEYLQPFVLVAYFSSLLSVGLIVCGVLVLVVEGLKSLIHRARMSQMAGGRKPPGVVGKLMSSPAFVAFAIGILLSAGAGLGWLLLPGLDRYDSNGLMLGWMTVFATWGAGMMLAASAVIAIVEGIRALASKGRKP